MLDNLAIDSLAVIAHHLFLVLVPDDKDQPEHPHDPDVDHVSREVKQSALGVVPVEHAHESDAAEDLERDLDGADREDA